MSLPWSTRMKILLGAAKGLAFLHEAENPVIYRDFKASNILLDSVIKLSSKPFFCFFFLVLPVLNRFHVLFSICRITQLSSLISG